MAAPEYVPVDPTRPIRAYASPPRRPQSWIPNRPGEVISVGQPRDDRFGNQGPDQGYVLRLVKQFSGKLLLTAGEHERDALAGAVAVALKRASLLGRAPVVHDVRVALTVWGFLSDAPADLVALRKPLFEEVWHPHHYAEQRRLADLVPEHVLRMTPEDISAEHQRDWRSMLAAPAAAS